MRTTPSAPSPILALALCALLSACEEASAPEPASGAATLEHTALAVDVRTRRASVTLRVRAEAAGVLRLAVGDLADVAIVGGDAALERAEDQLDVAFPSAGSHELTLSFSIPESAPFAGWSGASTYTWPTHCGNLFPCRPHPSDGGTFAVELTGLDPGELAVVPASIAQAPAYQVAFAFGAYERRALGITPRGTSVVAWALPAELASFAPGLDPLPALVGALEEALGATPFGPETGPVAVDWGAGARGGMEHHPHWHVARGSMADPVVQAHEAAHAWFGGSVRLRCWEDLVLSEGTASWLAAYAVEETLGIGPAAALWEREAMRLRAMLAPDGADAVAWPAGCTSTDPVADGIFGPAVYVKGAFFWRDVARVVGAPVLLDALRTVVERDGGAAVGMQELLDAVMETSGFDPGPLAQAWLRGTGAPAGWDAADAP